MKKMEIIFYRHSLLSRGGDKMVVEYANYLQARGHSITVMTNRESSVYQLQTISRKISVGSSKFHTILHALFEKRVSDIIIADIIMVTFFLSFRNRSRVLCFAQDYDESYYKNPFMKMLIRLVYFYCLRIRKIPVIAVSEELGHLLEKRFNARVTVVTNGVDGDIFYPDKDPVYLAVKANRRVVLVFARSDYRKGFDIAVWVLSAFKKEIDIGALAVWAVGEKINVPFKMHHFGVVSPEILRKILSCSDVLLYPSRHEGFPLFVLEAMACGCPVVTTEAVQFVRNGIDALQCRVEDADALINRLRQMLSDEKTRSTIFESAFKTARTYDLKQSMCKFEECLLQYHLK